MGWSIADHLRTELVADALDMARLRRKPVGTVVHSDRGAQYTSWLFGHRLREAGLLGSMGRVASAFDNAMIESFFRFDADRLLDRRTWTTRAELATAIFRIHRAFYNPVRRHSALDYRSPIDYEKDITRPPTRPREHPTPAVRGTGNRSRSPPQRVGNPNEVTAPVRPSTIHLTSPRPGRDTAHESLQ